MALLERMKNLFRQIKSRVQKLSKIQKIIALVVIGALFFLAATSDRGTLEDVKMNETRAVSLINVGKASTESSPLEVTGTVRSETEASLRTESQGEVTGVYRTVGQFVTAGTIIAELRNTSERAAVQQAEASLEAARASLQKGTGGVRDEDRTILEINLQNATDAYANAQTSARNTLRGAYAGVDDAVVGSLDDLFSNPDSINPIFNLATSESEVVLRLKQNRILTQNILSRQTNTATTLDSNDALLQEIDTTEEEVLLVRSMLDDALSAINNAIPTPAVSETQIAGFKTSITAARGQINGTLSSLGGARSSLNNTLAALNIAEQNLATGVTGAQEEDVTALEAQVKQAEAGLALARANLARTLIITPISGTLNTLSLREGDFVGAFTPAATVSNNNALEVLTFVTEDDKTNIQVGSKALIDGLINGVITSISPGLDPVTKKIEVRVGVTAENANLTNGSSVRVSLDRNGFEIDPSEITEITIPISALKIETNRVITFTVDDDNMLVANEVTTGLVLGDSVKITEGLTPQMTIVEDARGLREGQEVAIKEN